MTEINFDTLIGFIEKEIDHFNKSEDSDAMDFVKEGMSNLLTKLLDLIKESIRVERNRIQGARDSIDATLYALMSKSSLKFDDDFKKMYDHAMGNACPWLRRNDPAPQRKTYPPSAVKEAADRLEKLRLSLKGRRADSAQQKITFITQESDLSYAVDILKNIAAEKAESEA